MFKQSLLVTYTNDQRNRGSVSLIVRDVRYQWAWRHQIELSHLQFVTENFLGDSCSAFTEFVTALLPRSKKRDDFSFAGRVATFRK